MSAAVKRWLLLAAVLALLTLCACAEPGELEGPQTVTPPANTSAPPAEEPAPAALTSFALPYLDQQTLDPVTCADGFQQAVGALLYDPLFSLDEHFALHGVLAESWVYDEREALYAVKLRPDVTFSDGSPLTAEDVAATLRRAVASPRYAARLAEVDYVAAGGESTVYIRLRAPHAGFLPRLDIPIVKSGSEARTVPLGTGRYVWQEDGEGPYLAARSAAWRGEDPGPERIGLVACKDFDTAAYAFYSRAIQCITCDLTGTQSVSMPGTAFCADAPTAVMQYVGCNTRSPLLAKPELRSVLTLGIDRAQVVDACLLGHGRAAQFPVSPASALYPFELEQVYAPGAYAAALAAIGFDAGTPRELTMIVNSENSFRVSMAQQVAQALSQCDLRVTVRPLAWDAFQAALTKGEYDLYYGECRLTADWDLSPLLAEKGALNFSGFQDAAAAPLLAAVRNARSSEERTAAVTALCSWLQGSAPFVPVCFKNASVLLPKGAVEPAGVTAADPFRGLGDWVFHWAE